MRLLKINLLALALILLSASVASAVQIRLEHGASSNQVDVFLDMGVDAGTLVNLVNVGVQTTDANMTYLGNEPPPTLAAIGGSPGIMLSFSPFAFLAPTPAYGIVTPSVEVPAGSSRVLLDWFSATSTNGSASGTENVLLGTLNYAEDVFQDYFQLVMGIDEGFFIDNGSEVVRADELVTFQNNLTPVPVPEPTTAMLIGLGLVGLGVAGRRNA